MYDRGSGAGLRQTSDREGISVTAAHDQRDRTFSIFRARFTFCAFSLLFSSSRSRSISSDHLLLSSAAELLLRRLSQTLRASASICSGFTARSTAEEGATGGRSREPSTLSWLRTRSTGTREPRKRCSLASFSRLRRRSSSASSSEVKL